MPGLDEIQLKSCLSSALLTDDVNSDDIAEVITYITSILADEDHFSVATLANSDVNEDSDIYSAIGPFLESSGCSQETIMKACQSVRDLARKSSPLFTDSSSHSTPGNELKKLKQGMINLSIGLDSQTEAEEEANRYMWGTDSGVAAFVNKPKDAYDVTVSSKDRRKQKHDLEKARESFHASLQEMEENETKEGDTAVSLMVLPDYNSGRNEKDIQVTNVRISLDNGRILLENADLKFSNGHRYGLVGPNGIGKTTLLKQIASLEIAGFPKHHRVLHVRQEIRANGNDVSVLQAVIQSDAERNALLREEKDLLLRLESRKLRVLSVDEERSEGLQMQSKNDDEFDSDIKKLDQCYARLKLLSNDTAEARAAQILTGLGFSPSMQSGKMSALSGGWRMRVSLAASLFIEPDLLLLDEPTNHLDLEAVLWMESYLKEYRHTVVVVSHDRGFLNEVCSDTIEFKNKTLTYYKGNYESYVKTSQDAIKNQMRLYQAYQDKREHMISFIEKFRANANRASIVQSRIKTVEKMDLECPPKVEQEPVWRFTIPNPEPLGRPIIAIDDASFDYNPIGKKESEYLLHKVNFGIDLDSRIGILGHNGAGKSTLLNIITDKVKPVSGSVSRHGRLRIGIFTQHSYDKFDLTLSALENMINLFPGTPDQEMRTFIGRFQIQGDEAIKPMLLLSGGQKSRIGFAALAFQKPHVIVMDEPTNHLDMESIDALIEAIQDFRGGLIVVSHDQYFISSTCKELWVVGDGKAFRFKGDFENYKEETLRRTSLRVAQSVKSLSSMNK